MGNIARERDLQTALRTGWFYRADASRGAAGASPLRPAEPQRRAHWVPRRNDMCPGLVPETARDLGNLVSFRDILGDLHEVNLWIPEVFEFLYISNRDAGKLYTGLWWFWEDFLGILPIFVIENILAEHRIPSIGACLVGWPKLISNKQFKTKILFWFGHPTLEMFVSSHDWE